MFTAHQPVITNLRSPDGAPIALPLFFVEIGYFHFHSVYETRRTAEFLYHDRLESDGEEVIFPLKIRKEINHEQRTNGIIELRLKLKSYQLRYL